MRQNMARRRPLTMMLLLMALVYATLLSACFHRVESSIVANANPQQGQQAIQRYGCGSCHVIPGIRGAEGLVGPPLTDWAGRMYIAGRLPNTPDNLIQWIQNPQAIDPENVMPNLGVTVADARDIAGYLYTLGGFRGDVTD